MAIVVGEVAEGCIRPERVAADVPQTAGCRPDITELCHYAGLTAELIDSLHHRRLDLGWQTIACSQAPQCG